MFTIKPQMAVSIVTTLPDHDSIVLHPSPSHDSQACLPNLHRGDYPDRLSRLLSHVPSSNHLTPLSAAPISIQRGYYQARVFSCTEKRMITVLLTGTHASSSQQVGWPAWIRSD